jgi:hypothetical protein
LLLQNIFAAGSIIFAAEKNKCRCRLRLKVWNLGLIIQFSFSSPFFSTTSDHLDFVFVFGAHSR